MIVVGSERVRRWYLLVVWLVVCGGFALQVWITTTTVLDQGRPWWDSLGVLLGYFTVTTNLLVAAVLTVDVFGWAPRRARWVSSESAVAMYIAVVGMVFHFLLREYVDSVGAQRVASEWLHYVNPVLYVGWWLLFLEKGRLRWKDAVWWMAYPAVYATAALVRGAITGFYPYWFVNADALGYTRVMENSLGFTGMFLVLGLVVVWADGVLARWLRTEEPELG
jgi:hypothetical protein